MKMYSDAFLNDSYLKYVGWTLHDRVSYSVSGFGRRCTCLTSKMLEVRTVVVGFLKVGIIMKIKMIQLNNYSLNSRDKIRDISPCMKVLSLSCNAVLNQDCLKLPDVHKYRDLKTVYFKLLYSII